MKVILIKFLFIGLTATILDFLIYYLLTQVVSISLGKLLSMICACTYSYFMNKNWTFNYKKDVLYSVFKYIISQVINIFSNVWINYIVYSYENNKIVSFLIATIFSAAINYILQKRYVFKS